MAENKISRAVIGREAEQQLLETILTSGEPELVAIYGRRRVGKTYLVRQAMAAHLSFEFSGIHNATLGEQLRNFAKEYASVLKLSVPVAEPANWTAAFTMLQAYLEPRLRKRTQVVFFDEFPWIHTPKSRFLQAFEHFWNSWGSRQPNLKVIICGSAAAWMIERIIRNRGGLHNRVTRRIRLLPFTVSESEAFLKARHNNLDRYQILQLYMVLGGIPHYLKEIQVGESATQAIDRICFTKDGLLQTEFTDLYHSLFEKAGNHIDVIRALAARPGGLTRAEIIHACGLTTGGWASQILEELTESGFITPYIPFGKTVRESIFRLTDEYSHFYIKFIEHTRLRGAGSWTKISRGASWRSWSGYAFESICLKHQHQLKKGIGIEDVYTESSAWRLQGQEGVKGAQIDLLIDRQDNCISICELKFSQSAFTIDKGYAAELREKVEAFRAGSKTRKTLFLTMVTAYGVKKNEYYTQLVQKELTMDALFL